MNRMKNHIGSYFLFFLYERKCYLRVLKRKNFSCTSCELSLIYLYNVVKIDKIRIVSKEKDTETYGEL